MNANANNAQATATLWPGVDEELNPFGVTKEEWDATAAWEKKKKTPEYQASAARFVHDNTCGDRVTCEHPEFHESH